MNGDLHQILKQVKGLASRYRALTGKPLGVTGEIAEVMAAELLDLKLADARQAGYDAVQYESGREVKVQIKGRCVPGKVRPGERIGAIQLDKQWDVVVLVIMDTDYEVMSIHEVERPAIEAALRAPGSKARNDRGALAVSKFQSLGSQVWP